MTKRNTFFTHNTEYILMLKEVVHAITNVSSKDLNCKTAQGLPLPCEPSLCILRRQCSDLEHLESTRGGSGVPV
jgi:hypothetical protein